jgi:hypothetical protein
MTSTIVPATGRGVERAQDDRVPSIELHVGDGPIAETLRGALDLIFASGLLRPGPPGGRPDLIHTVGDVGRWTSERQPGRTLPLVHTVDRVPLRGNELAPRRRWVRRERARRRSLWLTHGRTSGRLVVEAGLAPGERIRCLPVLPAVMPTGGSGASRSEVRRALGVGPGVRLVLGEGGGRGRTETWSAAIRNLGRCDLVALATRPQAGRAFSLPELLAAADVFIAAGHELTAATEGAAALAIGLPVVALTTDATAELVSPGRSGIVVTPRPEAIADAVVALVDGGRTTRRPPAPGRCPAEIMARELVEIYSGLAPLPPQLRRWGR